MVFIILPLMGIKYISQSMSAGGCYLPPAVDLAKEQKKEHASFKNSRISNWKVEHQMKPSWPLRPCPPPLSLCCPTAWMLSVNVWIWPTRNGLTTLKRHIDLEIRSWDGSFSKWRKAGCASAHIPHLLSAINHQLLHALCKVLKCSHKPCCECTGCPCVIVIYKLLTQNLFESVFLDFWFIMFCGNKNYFCLDVDRKQRA